MKRSSGRNINLATKKMIVGKIRQHKMTKIEHPSKSAMVAIPETEDAGGKPMFINSLQFNKLVVTAEQSDRKRK